MDSTLTSQLSVELSGKGAVFERKEDKEKMASPAYVSVVDPFLVEALQNPRHRLTILRMELDIRKFLQNPELHQFEFPHFPTSYLRLAAHRVAQHYGLQTMGQDNVVDGQGIRILVIKKPETKFPTVCLSDVPAKESENDKLDQIKIVIRPRPKDSLHDARDLKFKRNSVRSVEERKEEYDRARARIFSSPSSSESEDSSPQGASGGRYLSVDESDISRNSIDGNRIQPSREVGNSSVVAILRDREKDRTDPDYDRSYDRYVRNIPTPQNCNVAPFNMHNFQPPIVHFPRMPPPQPCLNYGGPVMSMGLNQPSRDALYMQWPTQTMMYAQSYDQLRHAVFQAPFCQQPLSFDYSQNHR